MRAATALVVLIVLLLASCAKPLDELTLEPGSRAVRNQTLGSIPSAAPSLAPEEIGGGVVSRKRTQSIRAAEDLVKTR